MSTIVGSKRVSGATASSLSVKGLIAYDRFPRFVSAGAASRAKTLTGATVYSGTTAQVVEFNAHAERLSSARHVPAITMDHAASSFKAAGTLSFAEHAAKTEKTPMIADSRLNLAVMLFGQYVAAGFDAPHGAAGIDITHIESAAHQIALAPHHG